MKKKMSRVIAYVLIVCMLGSNLRVVHAGQVKGVDYSNADPSYQSGPYYQNLLKVNLTGNQREDIVAVANSQVGYRERGRK